jgi:hypothetical protein
MYRFSLESLESRQLLSTAPLIAQPGASQEVMGAMTAYAAPPSDILTLSDRQELLTHLAAPLAASLAKTLRHTGAAAFDATLLKYMIRRPGPYYFFNGRQLTRIFADPLFRQFPDLSKAIQRADAVLEHRFPEQISATAYNVQLPQDIDWDAQPTTTGNPNFLHGLNRQSFWKDLGIAYRDTGDGKYVRELVSELESWSAQNPPLDNPDDWRASSPHWWLLDASDRATNWTFAYMMVLGSPDWIPATNTLFLKEMWEHGDFLNRVTPSSYKKNRTALHAAALSQIGMLFPEFTDAAAWEYHGTDMTFRALAAQFYPDGGHVEESPSYGMFTLNSLLGSYQLATLNNRDYWTKNRRKLVQNGVEAIFQVLDSYAELPALSDTYRSSTVGRFFSRAAIALNEKKYVFAGGINLEDLISAGGDVNSFPTADTYLQHRPDSYALPDSGYYILRSDGTQVIFDAGPKGGSHGHYDLLNFELSRGSVIPIPDPGPYTYDDSPERQRAISTPAHNTLSIDGLNHEALEGAHNPKIVVDGFSLAADEGRVSAHHDGYDYLAGAPTVGRTLWIDRTQNVLPLIIIIDWGVSRHNQSHTFTSSLNLSTTSVTETAPGDFDMGITRTNRMRVQALLQPGQSTSITNTIITNEPPPDDKTPAKQFSVSQTGTSALFVTLASLYIPGGFNPSQPASIAFDGPPHKGRPVHLRLTMPDGTVRLLDFAPPDLSALAAGGGVTLAHNSVFGR